jgi:hypothetical protein
MIHQAHPEDRGAGWRPSYRPSGRTRAGRSSSARSTSVWRPISPERRREGLATALLSPILNEADRLGNACCLETSTEENRRFYENEGASSRQERSSCEVGQIRGGYVGIQRGWLPSGLGIGKNKEVHEAPTALSRTWRDGIGTGVFNGRQQSKPPETKASVASHRGGMIEPEDQGPTQEFAEIPDGPLMAHDSSLGSQHPRHPAVGQTA